MKIIAVQFPDNVDITTIAVGVTPVSVNAGTVTIGGGTLMSQTTMTDPELVPHGHNAVIGPAQP